MPLARKLDIQYQLYYKTIFKTFLEEMPLLLPRFGDPRKHKKGIIEILFKAIVSITLEAVSAFIRQRRR